MMRWRKWLLLFAVAFSIVVVDQISKAIIVANLALGEEWMPIEAIRPYFAITHVQNTGAAFGIFPQGGTLFTFITLIVVALIIYFYRELPDRVWLVRIAIGLQLGGALGNFIDRVRQGYVVDFLHAKSWPVFNVADSSLVVGVIGLLILMWIDERRLQKEQQAQEPCEHCPPEDEPSSITPG